MNAKQVRARKIRGELTLNELVRMSGVMFTIDDWARPMMNDDIPSPDL